MPGEAEAPADPLAEPAGPVLAAVASNVRQIRQRIQAAATRAGRSSEAVRLVAISKTFPADRVVAAIRAGVQDIGENRVQEASTKIAALAAAGYQPRWHLVGHLQSNKVKAAIDRFAIIHSVDSVHLAERIDRLAAGRYPVLLEVNLAREASKTGFVLPPAECALVVDEHGVAGEGFAEAFDRISRLARLNVQGLMTVAPAVDDPERVRPVFRQLRELASRLGLRDLSMGMTEDFEIAVEEGATLIRLGRAIFGERAAAQ